MGSLKKSLERFCGAAPLKMSLTLFSHWRWLSRGRRVDGPGDVANAPTIGASGAGGGGITGPPPAPVLPVVVFGPPGVPLTLVASPMLPAHPKNRSAIVTEVERLRQGILIIPPKTHFNRFFGQSS